MRSIAGRTVAASAVAVLVLGACGSDSDDATVDTEATIEDAGSAVTDVTENAGTEVETADTDVAETTSEVPTEATDADGADGAETATDADADEAAAAPDGTSPAEVVKRELAAQMEGDWEAVAALWADDAVAVQPDGTEIAFYDEVPFPIDDFDGDGVVTIMDDHLAAAAITPAMGKTISAECTDVSDTVADCTETTSNAFSEAAGVDPLVIELQITVEDGLIVRQEFIGPVGDPAAFETATMSGFAGYGEWVAETAPDEHPVMFDASGMTMTMEAVELHNRMLPTYVEEMSG